MMHSARRWIAATAAAIIVLGSVDVVLAMQMRKEAREESAVSAQVAGIFDETVRPEDGIVLDVKSFSESDILVGYVLRPRPVLYVDRAYAYTPEQLATMVRNVGGVWLFARSDAPLLSQLPLASPEPVRKNFPPPFADHALYRLETLGKVQPAAMQLVP
jgi:hypothetical protein